MSHLRVVAVEQMEDVNSRGRACGVAKALRFPFPQTVKVHCVLFHGMGRKTPRDVLFSDTTSGFICDSASLCIHIEMAPTWILPPHV